MSTAREVISEILEKYKNMPYLWDKKHKHYNNRETRKEGIRTLLKIYKRMDQYATVKTLTKKIQNLRTSYHKERKKISQSLRKGATEDEVYKPSLWYFDALCFLEANNDQCHSSKDPLDTEDTTGFSSSDGEQEYSIQYHDDEDIDRSSTPQNCMSPPTKKRNLDTSFHETETKEYFIQDTKEIPSTKMKDEEWEILGKSIGLQLRDLSKKQLVITQKIISDAIYYGKLGMLSENAYLALGPSHTVTFPNCSVKQDTEDDT